MRTDKLTTDKHTDTHRYTLIILLLRSPTQNEIKISEIATENRLAKKIWPVKTVGMSGSQWLINSSIWSYVYSPSEC